MSLCLGCKYRHILIAVNKKVFFFFLHLVLATKKGNPKVSFLLTLSRESYFTTNLMVLLKPLALMVQK